MLRYTVMKIRCYVCLGGLRVQQPKDRDSGAFLSVKVVAYTMAWSIVTAGVSSQFDAVGVAEENAKDGPKVQQSDLLADHLADVKIAEQVKAVVRRDPDVRTVDVVVFVRGGVVTLSGTVSTAHQRSQAEQLASRVEGVAAVVNKIAVSNISP